MQHIADPMMLKPREHRIKVNIHYVHHCGWEIDGEVQRTLSCIRDRFLQLVQLYPRAIRSVCRVIDPTLLLYHWLNHRPSDSRSTEQPHDGGQLYLFISSDRDTHFLALTDGWRREMLCRLSSLCIHRIGSDKPYELRRSTHRSSPRPIEDSVTR